MGAVQQPKICMFFSYILPTAALYEVKTSKHTMSFLKAILESVLTNKPLLTLS